MAFKKILKGSKEVQVQPPPQHEVKKEAWPEKDLEKGLEDALKVSDADNLSTIALAWKAYQFADNMTMHGVRYIFAKDMSKFRRMIWICAVLGLMAYCSYLVHETMSGYFLYPTSTYLSKTFESKSLFPAVTICNFNAFQKSKMSRAEVAVVTRVYGEKFGLADLNQFVDYTNIISNAVHYEDPSDYQNTYYDRDDPYQYGYDSSESDSSYLTSDLENSSFGTNESLSNLTDAGNQLRFNLTSLLQALQNNQNASNITLENYQNYDLDDLPISSDILRHHLEKKKSLALIEALFHKINVSEFFKDTAFDYSLHVCQYRDKPCNQSHFSKVLTDFGVCMKFDPSLDSSAAYQTILGPSGGFFFGAQFIQEDWTPGPNFYGEGFRIAIHPPGTTEYNLVDNGFSVRPKLTTEVALSQQQEIYLSYPYGQCGSRTLAFFSVYSKSLCLFECYTNHTVSVCGCKRVDMPGPDPVCTFAQLVSCMEKLHNEEEFENDEEENLTANVFDPAACVCPQDCVVTKYDMSVTHTDPSRSFSEALNTNFKFDVETNAVTFQIFFKEFQVSMQVEEATYTIQKLLSELGGAGGLFLGCSFLTFFEVIDFVVDMLWFVITKKTFFNRKKLLEDEKNQP